MNTILSVVFGIIISTSSYAVTANVQDVSVEDKVQLQKSIDYYSSRYFTHYLSSQWTCGDDGVWRDSDGYVVCAANCDCVVYDIGDVINTPFGKAKVYDCYETRDTVAIYTNW